MAYQETMSPKERVMNALQENLLIEHLQLTRPM